MTGADRGLLLGALALSALVPVGLAALQPFGEARATLGVAAGWGAALAVTLPGWLLLGRTLAADGRGFLKGFLGASLMRLLLTIAAVLAFALLVQDAPLRSFVLAFFAGYVLLTALELRLVLGRRQRGAST
ncbi:MAG: hypothetical protein FJ296_02485 [Planctomycetes bacterium]|nr:hypothetical protein [Planctomycetota bacterium]